MWVRTSPRRGMLAALLSCVLACVAACNDGNIGDAFGNGTADEGDGGGPTDAGIPDAASPDATACTDGDRQSVDGVSGTCYFALTTTRSYLQGRADCQAAGADLVRVDSSAENDLVFALANNPPLTADWWLGGNDLVQEGKFVWLDDVSEIVSPLFDNWRSGEPNNGGINGEDCMILESDNPLKEWDDRPCGNLFPVICERAP